MKRILPQVPDEDATEAVAVEIVDSAGQVERIERNERNSFFRIFQPNKWRLKKEKAAREVAGAVA